MQDSFMKIPRRFPEDFKRIQRIFQEGSKMIQILSINEQNKEIRAEEWKNINSFFGITIFIKKLGK